MRNHGTLNRVDLMETSDAPRAVEQGRATALGGSSEGDRWRIVEGVAWVMEDERVALVNTGSTSPLPLIVHDPVAGLWPALADGPVSVDRLREVADGIVEADPEGFVHAALEMLCEANLVVRVGGE